MDINTHDENLAELKDKTLIMLVGPSGIGKSYIIKEIIKNEPEFGRVKSFTTREMREDDDADQYLYLSTFQVLEHERNGSLITSVTFPTTGSMYGTLAHSYQAKFNLLDTLSNSVDVYRSLPFEKTITISVVAQPYAWRDWFLARYPEPGEERTRRLLEAKQSIEWSLAQQKDHFWVANEPDNEADVANKIIALSKSEPAEPQDLSKVATSMLEMAEELLDFKEVVHG